MIVCMYVLLIQSKNGTCSIDSCYTAFTNNFFVRTNNDE
jgi:hypothetical protein